jgi:hypothetical protein
MAVPSKRVQAFCTQCWSGVHNMRTAHTERIDGDSALGDLGDYIRDQSTLQRNDLIL